MSTSYPHMCRDDHVEIGHSDSEHEMCPLCRANAEIDRLKDLTFRLRMEAQGHAGEARAANHTIREIYQHVSQGRGEPGNWNGARPVIEEIDRLREFEPSPHPCGDDFPQ